MKQIFIILFMLVSLSLKSQTNKTIFIQPLGEVESIYLTTVKKTIEEFYKFPCVIRKKVEFSPTLLSPSKTRYEASKILRYFPSNENLLIVTEKDITIQKGKNPEWGILGLGLRPGNVCVVSTHRMKRKVSKEKIIERLKKVSIHEVGHNLGLDHCTNDIECLMNDARGTISQVDNEKIFLCYKCKKQIGMK